ncbi:hypothetical protein LEP1GSC038_1581 [Leptospira weilii str. 2006001855]|uniref:Uncharacterized protein n=1 Tax=Leptospira weilii str. 2006001855 TaxID=996804 RepID=M6FDX8_9LEPT|nr:hypothetical protein LEP1GSC038_1581 [Leptospira weilii str. 2006001855]
MTPKNTLIRFFRMIFLIGFQKSIYFEASLNDIMNSLKYAPVISNRFSIDNVNASNFLSQEI